MTTIVKYLFVFGSVLLSYSCKDYVPLVSPNVAAFNATERIFDDKKDEVEFNVTLSRPEIVDVPVKLILTSSNLTYGTDFTIEPAATRDTIALKIPAGQTFVSLKVKKATGLSQNGDEQIALKIASVGDPVIPGFTSDLKVSFTAIIATGSASSTINGKGDSAVYANTVYLDLSGNNQKNVDRKSWNLGFYSGSDYRVIINPHYQSTVKATSKSDITTVTLDDTLGIRLDHDSTDLTTVGLTDSWVGDLSKTAIAAVSATDLQNKVYLYSFEGNKKPNKWFKIKISRNGTGYKLAYALVGSTTIKTLEVAKNTDFNFVFASLETDKMVSVEPRAKNWDFSWGYTTYDSGLGTPNWVQDVVMINNLGGTKAAELLVDSVGTYESFNVSKIAKVTFLNASDVIGTKWRVAKETPGSTIVEGVRKDRFYVIKDSAGNVYKVRFQSFTSTDGGERGRPKFEYSLVKKGL